MTEYLTEIIQQYGLWAVFLVIMLEYACFPLPSELVLPLSGAIAAQGEFSFFTVLAVSVTAGLCGSMICYFIGHFGGAPLLKKFIKRFPKTRKGIDTSQHWFAKYSVLSVCLCRIIPLCRTYISLVAGIARQNKGTFLAASAGGILVWNTILVGFGFYFSKNWQVVVGYYEKYKMIVIILAAVAVVGYVGYRLIKHRRAKQAASKTTQPTIQIDKEQD